MKRFLFFFLLLSGFSSKSFGIENYNECGVFEEIVKRDFYEYSFDEPDNAIPDRIVPEHTSSSYGMDADGSYKRSKNGSIFLSILPASFYQNTPISPGTEIFSINSIETSEMDYEQINELLSQADENEETLLISSIGANGDIESFELDYTDVRESYIPIEFEILSIDSIDSITSTYKARFKHSMTWGLAGLESILKEIINRAIELNHMDADDLNQPQLFYCEYTRDEFESLNFWTPDILLSNVISMEGESTQETFAVIFSLDPSPDKEPEYMSTIFYSNVSIATFKSSFNYQPFPFDSQELVFSFEAPKGSLIPYFDLWSGSLAKSFNSIQLYEWNKKSFEVKSYYVDDTYGGQDIGIAYIVNLERNYIYFLTKIYLPIVLILFLAFATLWIKPSEIEPRLTVSVVCFLALITYTFIIDRDLPKLAYLTSMDLIILTSYFFAAIPTLESVYVHQLSKDNNEPEAIDAQFRLYLPLIYLFMTLSIIILTILNHPNAVEAFKFTT